MKSFIAALALVLAAATPAFATDLVNQDNKTYKVTIVEGSITSTKDIGPNGAIYGLCTTGPCTFKIAGGSAVAEKNDRVVISNGAIKKQ